MLKDRLEVLESSHLKAAEIEIRSLPVTIGFSRSYVDESQENADGEGIG